MIQHPWTMPEGADSPEAFVFAQLFGSTCSICAPMDWPKARVELYACASMRSEGWQSVDIADVIGGQALRHRHTPNPCDQAPTQRQHWFLIRSP